MRGSEAGDCEGVDSGDSGDYHHYTSSALFQRCLVSVEHLEQKNDVEIPALDDTLRATEGSNADDFVDVCSAMVRHLCHGTVAEYREKELASQHAGG